MTGALAAERLQLVLGEPESLLGEVGDLAIGAFHPDDEGP